MVLFDPYWYKVLPDNIVKVQTEESVQKIQTVPVISRNIFHKALSQSGAMSSKQSRMKFLGLKTFPQPMVIPTSVFQIHKKRSSKNYGGSYCFLKWGLKVWNSLDLKPSFWKNHDLMNKHLTRWSVFKNDMPELHL